MPISAPGDDGVRRRRVVSFHSLVRVRPVTAADVRIFAPGRHFGDGGARRGEAEEGRGEAAEEGRDRLGLTLVKSCSYIS